MATNYDDAFRTLLNDYPQLILPVINETFQTDYDGTENVFFEPNEHFANQAEGAENKIITDTSFGVVSNRLKQGEKGHIRKFHWESESGNYDPTLLIRIYEYDSQIALDYNHRIEGNKLIVEFPNSAVLLLRSTQNTPDEMEICIVVPNGESISYPVKTLKVQKYSLDDIFEKKLLFLLPFYLFTYDSRLEQIAQNTEAVKDILEEYERIRNQLEKLQLAGIITLAGKRIIMDMINHVVQLRCKDLKPIQEGVKKIMAGQILYSEAYALQKEGEAIGEARGEAIGEARGEARGRIEGQLEMLKRLVEQGLMTEETAKAQEAEIQRSAVSLD